MKHSTVSSTAIARLFSSCVISELATFGKSPAVARLLRESGLLRDLDSAAPLSDAYQLAFQLLKLKDNRHEYIYKAALTQKVLMGVHSLETASMLTEFRVGACKADVVILNGTGAVYEIKSERDNLARLKSQIAAYLKVFATVNVIVSCSHLSDVLNSTPSDVGVMELTSSFTIRTHRKAVDDPCRTSSREIFSVMRMSEVESILRRLNFEIPETPNTRRFGVLKGLFEEIDPPTAHREMVATLKQSRSLLPLKSLISQIPSSLHSATLTCSMRRRDHDRYAISLQTPIASALCWG